MKVFESFLSQQMEAFISYRKDLGYHVKNIRTQLLVLDRYICRQPNPTDVWRPAFYLKIRKDLNLEPNSTNFFLYTTRCFFQYLVRTGQCRNNPVQDVPAMHLRAFIPYVFSPEQVDELLNTLCNQIRRNRRFFLKDLRRLFGYFAAGPLWIANNRAFAAEDAALSNR
jgi:integrase/recombinase XerD